MRRPGGCATFALELLYPPLDLRHPRHRIGAYGLEVCQPTRRWIFIAARALLGMSGSRSLSHCRRWRGSDFLALRRHHPLTSLSLAPCRAQRRMPARTINHDQMRRATVETVQHTFRLTRHGNVGGLWHTLLW